MSKRTAAVIAALITLWPSAAYADSGPTWPCTVPVSIEPGPFVTQARSAVRQLDKATAISWPIVEDGALVEITWGDPEPPMSGYAWWYATDTARLSGGIVMDAGHDPVWIKTGLLHELGHIAGLDHNDDERSVMNAKDVPWRRFQRVDLERLAAVRCA